MKNIKSILFVCTGNSCRSVMAEGLLKKYLSDKNDKKIKVSSCGTLGFTGNPPTINTIDVLKAVGVDMTTHKSSALTKDLINASDLILAMEPIHKEEVLRLAPQADGKVYLLKEYVKKKGEREDFLIPDPIGRPLEVYERILSEIKGAVERLMETL